MNKTVLITGCSSGIGRACANYLRQRGWRVFAAVRREEDRQSLQKEGFESCLIDVTNSDSIRAGVEWALGVSGGTLDALVNNAGIMVLGAVEDISLEGMRRQFETNFFGGLELTQRVIPVMRSQKSGRIIFISSPNSNGFGYPFMGIEAASKAALETAVSALRRELRGTGIMASTVCPSEMHTAIMKKASLSLSRYVNTPSSRHKETYATLLKSFEQENLPSTATDPLRVAEAVASLLESKFPRRRVMVPASAGMHYLAHALLPEWLQDILLFRKIRKTYGIKI